VAIKIPNEKNAFMVDDIAKSCITLSIKYKKSKNLKDVLNIIDKSDQKIFLITGSLYLVGKIRTRFL